jgi:hypothetical protein
MGTPNRLKVLEAEKGELDNWLPDFVNRSGGAKAAARKLGFSDSTIVLWLKRNNYVLKCEYVKAGE